jgi:hypothetical protein
MPKFYIRHALGGGFGGVKNASWEEIEAEDIEKATDAAWELACEDYGSYVGLHGLRDLDQIMEEDDVGEDEAIDIYGEERESWLDYEAVADKPEDYEEE